MVQMIKQEVYIDNEYKWKAIATVGIWIGAGIAMAFAGDGWISTSAGVGTLVIWLFG